MNDRFHGRWQTMTASWDDCSYIQSSGGCSDWRSTTATTGGGGGGQVLLLLLPISSKYSPDDGNICQEHVNTHVSLPLQLSTAAPFLSVQPTARPLHQPSTVVEQRHCVFVTRWATVWFWESTPPPPPALWWCSRCKSPTASLLFLRSHSSFSALWHCQVSGWWLPICICLWSYKRTREVHKEYRRQFVIIKRFVC